MTKEKVTIEITGKSKTALADLVEKLLKDYDYSWGVSGNASFDMETDKA